MKKILIANDLLTGGGVENVLYNMVRYLIKNGYDVTLMIPNCSQEEVSDLFEGNVKLYKAMRSVKPFKRLSIPWFFDRTIYVIQRLIFLIKIFFYKFDVLIALKEGPTMKGLADCYAKKKFAWIHTDYGYMHWTNHFFKSNEAELKCMGKYDKIVCVSNAARDSVVRTIGDPGNLCVRYNPIDYTGIQKLSNNECIAKKTSEQVLFVTVGRLEYSKNYNLLLDVCLELEKKYTFSVWIVGSGSQKKELEEKINANLMQSVKLLGEQNNPYSFMKKADVFISSSICESFGLAIQEALVLGKPVVAVECPAVKETLDPRFGILVNNDFQALYDAMEKMLVDENLRLGYEKNIKEYLDKDKMFENRLQDICSLWE